MYGTRQQLHQAIYMRNLVRHRALQAGGTPFGAPGDYEAGLGQYDPASLTSVQLPQVYEIGSGRQLDQSLMDRQERRLNAVYGLALRAFMKSRKGIPLLPREQAALKKVGGIDGLVAWFGPKGIDVESASQEGEIVELAPEEEILAVEELTGSYLKGEVMGFGTILLIAGGVGLGIFLLGRMTG